MVYLRRPKERSYWEILVLTIELLNSIFYIYQGTSNMCGTMATSTMGTSILHVQLCSGHRISYTNTETS